MSLLTGTNNIRKMNPDSVSPLLHWLTGRNLIGTEFVSVASDTKGTTLHSLFPLQEDKKNLQSSLSLQGGLTNYGFSEKMPPIKNGHIEPMESSRL